MKYNAKQLTNGKWAVCAGKKFFRSTMGTKEFAQEKAIELSIYWHRDQVEALRSQLEEKATAEGRMDWDKMQFLLADGSVDEEYTEMP